MDLHERLSVWLIFIKKLGQWGAVYFAIPTFLSWRSLEFGLSSGIMKPEATIAFINKYGLLALLLITILAGAETAYVFYQKSRKNFYAASAVARIR